MGPILYILYISRPYHVIANHLPSAHGYADDTQLYLSFEPNGRSLQDHAIAPVEACISDLVVPVINYQKSQLIPSPSVILPSSLSTVFKTRVPGLTPICLCTFTLTFGDYAFARSGPLLWNNLPLEIRNSQSAAIFKSKLKTHLFKLAYKLF
ncbi:hypothetical protein pdam_00012178 [Pocillopora damicornis]|uniref:Reverse transcriptase domain-containing protein n=1 Tax=Pocillopora damicornis TaxID=46731 RepID=A0A3M6UES0_POCDA|nr:hypothetical protein pdam_00012178 [Pocillopora damicornis]